MKSEDLAEHKGTVTRYGEVHSADIETLQVVAWCREGGLKSEQVILIMTVWEPYEHSVVMRLKAPHTVDWLIEELENYRDQVWPDVKSEEGESL